MGRNLLPCFPTAYSTQRRSHSARSDRQLGLATKPVWNLDWTIYILYTDALLHAPASSSLRMDKITVFHHHPYRLFQAKAVQSDKVCVFFSLLFPWYCLQSLPLSQKLAVKTRWGETYALYMLIVETVKPPEVVHIRAVSSKETGWEIGSNKRLTLGPCGDVCISVCLKACLCVRVCVWENTRWTFAQGPPAILFLATRWPTWTHLRGRSQK